MNTSRSRIPARILGAGIALLMIAELVARFAGSPVFPQSRQFIEAPEWSYPQYIARHRERFWEYRGGQTIAGHFMAPGRYTINTEGFRNPVSPSPKQDGVMRVVCMGGSTTFGLGVGDEAVYPRQLERRLNALDTVTGRHWEVINAGVTNYTTYQGLSLARDWLPRWQPDIVLYHYGWADHQPAADGIVDRAITMPPTWRLSMENLLLKSVAAQWGVNAWLSAFPPETGKTEHAFKAWRVNLTDYTANIERLIRSAQEIKARAILVTPPISWPPPGQTDTSGMFHYHHRYHRVTRYAAVSAGGEYVEMANAFNIHPEFFDDPRRNNELFNAAGHAFAGEFLARFILGLPLDSLQMMPDRSPRTGR